MPAGTIVQSGSLVSPGGQQGPSGPNAVSTDANNAATWGSDNKLFVPLASATRIGAINKLSASTGDFLDGTNTFRSLATSGNALWIKRAGDTINWPAGNQLQIQTTNGVNSSGWNNAPLLIATPSTPTGSRPQIGFLSGSQGAGLAATLYYDGTFQYLDSANVNHVLWDSNHSSNLISGFTLGINAGAGLQIAGQETVISGGVIAVNSGGYLNITGGQLYIQSGGQFIVQNGGQMVLQAGSTLTMANTQGGWQITSDTGLAAGSWSAATVRITATVAGARPGIGFLNSPTSLACYFYYGTDNKFHFIDNGNVDHIITSS